MTSKTHRILPGGLIAAIAFVALVGALFLPLYKLSKTFDAATKSIEQVTEHSVPILDHAATTVATTNVQLERVDTMTTAAAQTAENVSALAGLYSATLGRPLVKVAAFSYATRQAFAGAGRAFSKDGSTGRHRAAAKDSEF
jgi:hypothetical protein